MSVMHCKLNEKYQRVGYRPGPYIGLFKYTISDNLKSAW